MIITDPNKVTIDELEIISRVMNVTFIINDGIIIGMEEDADGK